MDLRPNPPLASAFAPQPTSAIAAPAQSITPCTTPTIAKTSIALSAPAATLALSAPAATLALPAPAATLALSAPAAGGSGTRSSAAQRALPARRRRLCR